MSNSFDFDSFKANAIEQLKAGIPLSGKDGVLAPLLENLLNSALEGEMDSPLGFCDTSEPHNYLHFFGCLANKV